MPHAGRDSKRIDMKIKAEDFRVPEGEKGQSDEEVAAAGVSLA
jgi:hypothetical protein